MRIFQKFPVLRWVVPGVTAVALVAGGSAIQGIQAIADTGLPARSAAQLLVDVQQARLDGLSGTVVQTSDLGLPGLPSVDGSGGSASSDLSSLISGSHTMRVWLAGPDQARMALLGTLGESDVIRSGANLWVWASRTQAATHYVLPTHAGAGANKTTASTLTGMPTTPQAAASQALAAINPSTEVTTSATATVAGRSAYELVLKPREADSLVAEVRVAIDGIEHVPLRVQVFAKSVAHPVFEVGFSPDGLSFARPDAAQFTFNPPPGTTVTQGKVPVGGKTAAGSKTVTPQTKSADLPKVIGQGWASVVIVKVPTPSARVSASASGTIGSMGAQLLKDVSLLPEVSGSWGSGHLMAGTVFSALLTNDGRLVVGAVSPEGLYAALAAQ